MKPCPDDTGFDPATGLGATCAVYHGTKKVMCKYLQVTEDNETYLIDLGSCRDIE